jgi:flavoprotein
VDVTRYFFAPKVSLTMSATAVTAGTDILFAPGCHGVSACTAPCMVEVISSNDAAEVGVCDVETEKGFPVEAFDHIKVKLCR